MTDEPGDEDTASFGRKFLLAYAKVKGVEFARITQKTPTKEQLEHALRSRRFNYLEDLRNVMKLRQRLNLGLLTSKAKELGVLTQEISDDKIALSIAIYCKDRTALEELHLYQQSEPKRSTFAFIPSSVIPLTTWVERAPRFAELITRRLSNPVDGGLATLKHESQVGDKLRFVIEFDRKKHVLERGPESRLPGRKGPHDDFPLGKMVATYDANAKRLEVSAFAEKSGIVVQCLSEALTGKSDYFQPRLPSATKAITLLTQKDAKEELSSSQIRIIELQLRGIPWKGSPTFLHMQGDDLLQTVEQLDGAGVPLLGDSLSRIALITLKLDNSRRMTIDFENAKTKTVGRFTGQEEGDVQEFLRRWGIF